MVVAAQLHGQQPPAVGALRRHQQRPLAGPLRQLATPGTYKKKNHNTVNL